MTRGGPAVDLVIQTANGVLTGRFAPREAVTILAGQAPQARAEAARLATTDSDGARRYAQLAATLRQALAGLPSDRHLHAIIEDLERLERALGER